MAIQKIEGIRVKNFPKGEFAGGFIYSANFTQGGVSGPSKLTLNVVNEGVTSEIPSRFLGLRGGKIHKEGLGIKDSNKYTINIGSISLEMNLVGFSEEKTPETHLMNYEFIDLSHILDRIFVGLPNRHQKPTAKGAPYGITNLEALCPNCWTGEVNRKVKADMIALRDAAYSTEAQEFARLHGDRNMEYNFQYNPPRKQDILRYGGIITVGREDFIDHGSSAFVPVYSKEQKYDTELGTVTINETIPGELPCDIPNVTYKFVDLLAAVEYMGITIKGLEAMGKKSWRRGIRNDYRQSYTGTLREVLQNWCADFGYSFTWGMGERSIVFVDLSKGVESSFDEVKDIVENAKKATSKTPNKAFLVNNISYSTDILNTYSSNYLSYYLKPHRPKTYNPFYFNRINFHCLRINEVFTPAACGMPGGSWNPRSAEQFLISCALAKFDSTARTLYNILLKRWWAIGIQPTYEFTRGEKDDIFQHLNSENLESVLREMSYSSESGSAAASKVNAYIAYVNEDQASEWEEFERSIADEFLGQHYVMSASPQSEFDLSEFEACLPVMNYKQTVEMTPQAEKIYNASEVPWAKIAAKSPAVMAGANAYVAKWLAHPNVRNIYYLNVPAAFGTLQEEVDIALHGANGAEDKFKDLEKGVGWYDHCAIDSELWNHITDADDALKAALREEGQDDKALQGTGLTRIQKEIRNLESSANGSFYTNGYINTYNGKYSRIKHNETPKLLVVAPDYITRNASVGPDGGLNFKAIGSGFKLNRFTSVGSRDLVMSNPEQCTIRCESSILETLCKCPTTLAPESDFFVGLGMGLKGLEGPSFALTGPHGGTFVVLPVNSWPFGLDHPSYRYQGFSKTTASIRVLLEGKKLVLDGENEQKRGFESINTVLGNLPENTLGIRVNSKDITNDADMVFQALGSSDAPADPTSSLIQVVVPSNLRSGPLGSETMITLAEYHKRIKDYFDKESSDSDKPSRRLSFSMVGTDYDVLLGSKNLKNYLRPEKGLSSFSVNFSGQGISTSFAFETKPKELPKLEATMRKIEPTVWKSWYS